MFWAPLGGIQWRNLNGWKNDEKVRLHASLHSPTLLALFVVINRSKKTLSESSHNELPLRIFKVYFFYLKVFYVHLKS